MGVEVVEVPLAGEETSRPKGPGRRGFAFLACVNDDDLFARLRRSIDELIVPDGFELRVFAARGATSLTAAYNRLQAAGAGWRYKAYVHQDVVILNRNLVPDLVRLFRDRRIALVGAAGCRYLPPSCVWWDGSGVFGRVLELDEDRVLELEQPADEVERVEAVDGLCLMTQHDLPWDEEITGFHFYDIAQSTRYVLAGYDVVVPRQEQPWFGHAWSARDRTRSSGEYLAARAAFRAGYDEPRARFARSRARRRLRRLAARFR